MPTIARRVLGLFLALAVALTPSVVSASNGDWPQAGFDGGASRYNVSENMESDLRTWTGCNWTGPGVSGPT